MFNTSSEKVLLATFLILFGGAFALLKKWRSEEIDFPVKKKLQILLSTIFFGGFLGAFCINTFFAFTVGYSASLIESFFNLFLPYNIAAISSIIGLTLFPTNRKKLFGILYAVLISGIIVSLFTFIFDEGSFVNRLDTSFFAFIITAISAPPIGFISGWSLERLEQQNTYIPRVIDNV